MKSEDALTLACANLARSNPQGWDRFMAAFTARREEVRASHENAPITELPITAGQARAFAALSKTFTECKENAAKLEEKEKRK